MVPELEYLLGFRPPEHIDDMAGPEPFPRAFHAGQKFLGFYGEIVNLVFCCQAVVAHAAFIVFCGLPEIGQQPFFAAVFGFSKPYHVLQVKPGGPVLRGIRPADKGFQPGNVGMGKQEKALRLQSVPAGPADLLVIVFHAFGQIIMEHEPDIGLVDAHAKGDGGHHDPHVIPDEFGLETVPVRIIKPRMIGPHGKAPLCQLAGQGFHLFSGQAVDDAGILFVDV